MITQQELQKKFDYKDGQLIYKIKPCPKMKIGDVAGSLNPTGYIEIKINNKIYKAHRLIYIYHNGEIPDGLHIDHINGIKNDNCTSNLRLATIRQNNCNVSKQKNNTSGFKGVSRKRDKKWVAQIRINGKNKHLGYRDTKEAAYELYKSAADKHHKEFANY